MELSNLFYTWLVGFGLELVAGEIKEDMKALG